MRKNIKAKCHSIIHSAAGSAAAVSGFSSQIPCSDNVALIAIEIGMVIAIGKAFGIEVSRSAAKGFVMSKLGTVFGKCASKVLIGWIPVAGNVVNAATSASLVESLGWCAVEEFSRGNMIA